MPSTISVSVSRLLASSTVMTPSLPTLSIALAISLPMKTSPFAEIVPTWAISSFEVTFFEFFARSATIASTARSMPRFKSIGLSPAATALAPSRAIEAAMHGRGGGAVAGGVVLLGGDFAHQLGAEVLEPVGKFDFLGDGHAVLGDARRAVGFLDDDVAALRAERDFHRVIENFDAAQNAVARVGGETNVFGSHCL